MSRMPLWLFNLPLAQKRARSLGGGMLTLCSVSLVHLTEHVHRIKVNIKHGHAHLIV